MEYTNEINVEDYNQLRDMVGWGALPAEEAKAGLEHTDFKIACMEGTKTIGMARIVWDHGYVAYLSDVIVHEDYRGKGIGREMVSRLLQEIKKQLKPGWGIKVSLMAASGKEGFYEKLGFGVRPNDHSGAGMDMWIENGYKK